MSDGAMIMNLENKTVINTVSVYDVHVKYGMN